MKVCANCGIEIDGRDGENHCDTCDSADSRTELRRQRARARRRERDAVMESCGLKRVRGALGGIYWE